MPINFGILQPPQRRNRMGEALQNSAGALNVLAGMENLNAAKVKSEQAQAISAQNARLSEASSISEEAFLMQLQKEDPIAANKFLQEKANLRSTILENSIKEGEAILKRFEVRDAPVKSLEGLIDTQGKLFDTQAKRLNLENLATETAFKQMANFGQIAAAVLSEPDQAKREEIHKKMYKASKKIFPDLNKDFDLAQYSAALSLATEAGDFITQYPGAAQTLYQSQDFKKTQEEINKIKAQQAGTQIAAREIAKNNANNPMLAQQQQLQALLEERNRRKQGSISGFNEDIYR